MYHKRIIFVSNEQNMIYLTFYHGRNIFRGQEFVGWIKKNFPSAKFEGFEYGHYMAIISIPLAEFEAGKTNIPTKNLIRVEGKFDLLTKLAFGVKDFKNEVEDGRIADVQAMFAPQC